MSKYVKNLVSDHLRDRLDGVSNALLVNLTGIGANTNCRLRRELRDKNINLLVVKNSLANRAAADTPLKPLFEGLDGPAAVVWGGEDIVFVTKEITRLAEDKEFAPFEARRGLMDGALLSPDDIKAVSKWPSREEQLSILLGQILSPGAKLASQLTAVGAALASQIKQRADEEETATE